MHQNNIAAIPTRYKGVNMRSWLEARWAAFFDLIKWKWDYEPIDFKGWIPDFYVEMPACKRRGNDCSYIEKMYVEIKPIRDVAEFNDPAVMRCEGWDDFSEPAIAILGLNPWVSRWTSMSCSGDSGGHSGFDCNGCRSPYNSELDRLWVEAGNIVQWKARRHV